MRHIRTIALAVAASACSSGSSGVLKPVRDDGIAIETVSSSANDTAVIKREGLTARVRGFWANNGTQSIYVTYENTGSAPVSVEAKRVALTQPIGALTLIQVAEVAEPTAAGPKASDPAPRLMGGVDAPANASDILTVPVSARRTLYAEFARIEGSGERPVADEVLVASVPLAAGVMRVRLRCARGATQ